MMSFTCMTINPKDFFIHVVKILNNTDDTKQKDEIPSSCQPRA